MQNQTCESSETCDSESGVCTAIDAACAERDPNEAFCNSEDDHVTCGPDLVSSEVEDCEGLCDIAGCVPADCGDGVLSGDEGCDDENHDPGDGCNAVCQPEPTQLVVADNHTCALLSNGVVKCWGEGLDGHLGNGAYDDSAAPVTVDLDGPAVKIATGSTHSCAILEDGALQCWGNGGSGRLGLGDEATRATPGTVDLGENTVKDVACGSAHTCVVLDDDTVSCWGSNNYGQLAMADTTDGVFSATPVTVEGVSGVLSITAGHAHVCVLTGSKDITCWGHDDHGQLGDGGTEDPDNPTPVDVDFDGADVASVVAGRYHTCAITSDGSVSCWGRNEQYQLAQSPTSEGNSLPLPVNLGSFTALALFAGYNHTCAILDDGSARCWGGNSYGQLGIDTDVSSATPVTPELSSDPVSLALGPIARHVGALLSDGTAVCWGLNDVGQLGTGDTANRGDDTGEMAALVPISFW